MDADERETRKMPDMAGFLARAAEFDTFVIETAECFPAADERYRLLAGLSEHIRETCHLLGGDVEVSSGWETR